VGSIVESIELVQSGMLKAPEGFLETEFAELMAICNGCGAAGAKFDFVPDHIWGMYIGMVCNIHDYAYHVGKTESDKKRADAEMLTNLLAVIELRSSWILKWPRRQRALLYYNMVTDLGHDAYWANKEREVL